MTTKQYHNVNSQALSNYREKLGSRGIHLQDGGTLSGSFMRGTWSYDGDMLTVQFDERRCPRRIGLEILRRAIEM